jgi:hypothetical protein
MDEFSMFVLEDTLQFATEILPSDLISDYVAGIPAYVNAVTLDPADHASASKLNLALTRLSEIARENKKFVVAIRLQCIAGRIRVSDAA